MKIINSLSWIIFLLILINHVIATEYIIEIEPNLENLRADMNIIIKNIDNPNSLFFVIAHTTFFVSNSKNIGKVEGTLVPEIIITPGEKVGDMIFYSEEGFEPLNIDINTKSTIDKLYHWSEMSINLSKELNQTYDSYRIQLNNFRIPGLVTYDYENFPKDDGNVLFFVKIPPGSRVNAGFKLDKGFKIDAPIFAAVDFPDFQLIFNEESQISSNEGYTRQDSCSKKSIRLDHEKTFDFTLEKEGYLGISFNFNRLDIYNKFLDISILFIVFLALIAFVLREFKIYLTTFMFLLAVYSLYINLIPRAIPATFIT